MVEGPTAKAYATKISQEFRGEIVKDVFVKSSKRVYVPLSELIGLKFLNADSYGKNIIIFFDGLAVRVHLMMFGAIHIYYTNESLLKPEKLVRLLIMGDRKKLVVYNAPIVEVDKADKLLNRLKKELGPDPLSKEWDRRKAIENILKLKNEKIGVALLNQSVIGGVGNILRNEILFRAGVNPERFIKNLTEAEVERIVKECENLMQKFLELKIEKKGIKPILFVYNNYGGTCKVCGGKIKFYMQQPINRKTFVCVNCQRL
jgi:endonuclease-8